jgi:hypothetical protein
MEQGWLFLGKALSDLRVKAWGRKGPEYRDQYLFFYSVSDTAAVASRSPRGFICTEAQKVVQSIPGDRQCRMKHSHVS